MRAHRPPRQLSRESPSVRRQLLTSRPLCGELRVSARKQEERMARRRANRCPVRLQCARISLFLLSSFIRESETEEATSRNKILFTSSGWRWLETRPVSAEMRRRKRERAKRPRFIV